MTQLDAEPPYTTACTSLYGTVVGTCTLFASGPESGRGYTAPSRFRAIIVFSIPLYVVIVRCYGSEPQTRNTAIRGASSVHVYIANMLFKLIRSTYDEKYELSIMIYELILDI